MLYPTPDPNIRAGSRVGNQVACNTSPRSLGEPQPIPAGSGITFYRRPFKPTVVNQVIDDCFTNFDRVLAFDKAMKRYHPVYLPGDGYRMSSATWAALPEDARRWMIWQVALGVACNRLRPVRMTVNIRDADGRVFHRQPISTEFRCRSRGFRLWPDKTWYRC
jgi:hypothetical protein